MNIAHKSVSWTEFNRVALQAQLDSPTSAGCGGGGCVGGPQLGGCSSFSRPVQTQSHGQQDFEKVSRLVQGHAGPKCGPDTASPPSHPVGKASHSADSSVGNRLRLPDGNCCRIMWHRQGYMGMEDCGHLCRFSLMPSAGDMLSSGDGKHESCLPGVLRQMQEEKGADS